MTIKKDIAYRLRESFEEQFPNLPKSLKEYGCYGVADSVEQVEEIFFEKLKKSSRVFWVEYNHIYKNDQPSEGGWRWHKWGEYIGKQTPKCEHIYDEEGIDHVVCYHFHEIRRSH